jgi:hypothetical protein
MPFAFLIVGIIFVAAGIQGNSKKLLSLVKGEFTGKDSYLDWMVVILAVGSVGYVDELKPVSRAFLVLVLVVLVLKTGTGFFAKFTSALKTIQGS